MPTTAVVATTRSPSDLGLLARSCPGALGAAAGLPGERLRLDTRSSRDPVEVSWLVRDAALFAVAGDAAPRSTGSARALVTKATLARDPGEAGVCVTLLAAARRAIGASRGAP